MLQYFLNATAIWLISLVVYDVFLRRESYHTYNRFYLLCTFVLGLVLPAIQWQGFEYLQPALQQPVQNVIVTKDAIVQGTKAAATFDLEWWLAAVYIAGIAVAAIWLGIDIVKLTGYYTVGIKSKDGDWTIVETGREHAPFSFRKLLFVNTRAQYTDAEWAMLFAHEREHTRQLHVADLMLIQVSRVFLWFLPLVYVYHKRLLLVHEYQADNISMAQPSDYGHFLVEQAILGAAPNISHSFNRSPIKKRIIMLTRKSTNASKTKMLVLVPIAMASMFCFSQNGYSQRFERKGNTVTYNGNKFEMSQEVRDTMRVTDPVTNEEFEKVVIETPYPLKMNGRTIHNEGKDDVSAPAAYVGGDKDISTYLLTKLRADLQKLDDGQYNLSLGEFVIDEKGKIVYFDYREMQRDMTGEQIGKWAPGTPQLTQKGPLKFSINAGGKKLMITKQKNDRYEVEVDKKTQQTLFEKVSKLLTTGKLYQPAVKDGKPALSTLSIYIPWEYFKVEDHKIYERGKGGNWVAL